MRLFFAALLLVVITGSPNLAEDAVYELRVYTCEPGKLDALHERFKDHTMRLFEKHGMENVAYWTPIAGAEADPRLIYILRHQSREAASASWAGFRSDPEWKAVAKASEEKHGKILAKAPGSYFLTATDYSAVATRIDQKKVYELRIYRTAEGKLDALNARFRDHTVRIFERCGIKSFAYWTSLDEPDSKNVLTYVVEYESRDAAKAAWEKFRADEEWKVARAASEKEGAILAEAPESIYMLPVPYSPVKE